MKSAGFVYIYMCVYTNIMVVGELFTLGYLTGSQRRSGNLEYAKPGKFLKIIFTQTLSIFSLCILSHVALTHLHTYYRNFKRVHTIPTNYINGIFQLLHRKKQKQEQH